MRESVELTLRKVEFARDTINSGFFSEEQVTRICVDIGFNDTAFRDKTMQGKLNDYLLDKEHWIQFEERVK